MKHLLILFSLILLSSPVIGQSQRPETIIVPVSSMGDVSDTRKQMLENTLTDELKKHFRIVPQEKYEQVLEQVFEELEYEECSEDTCIMRVQEMLQVENVFHLQLVGEGNDIQLNLKWTTLEEKRNEEYFCEKCSTKDLYYKLEGLVEKLVGEKPEVMVGTPKVLPKKVQEPIIKETKVDKTEGLFVSVGDTGTILTSSDGNSWTKREPLGHQTVSLELPTPSNSHFLVKSPESWYKYGSPNPLIGNQVRHILILLSIILLSSPVSNFH